MYLCTYKKTVIIYCMGPVIFQMSAKSTYKIRVYSKTCVKRPHSKIPQIGFQDQLSFNVGQKYCRMLKGEHSAILSIFIKLQFVMQIFVLSIFEKSFYTGFYCTCILHYITILRLKCYFMVYL